VVPGLVHRFSQAASPSQRKKERRRFLVSSWSDLFRPTLVYLWPSPHSQGWYSRTPLRLRPLPHLTYRTARRKHLERSPLAVTSANHWRSAHRPTLTSRGSRPVASHLLTFPHQWWGTSTRGRSSCRGLEYGGGLTSGPLHALDSELFFFLCDGLAAYEKRYIRPGTTLGTSPTSVWR
jgi:hypothetical protein